MRRSETQFIERKPTANMLPLVWRLTLPFVLHALAVCAQTSILQDNVWDLVGLVKSERASIYVIIDAVALMAREEDSLLPIGVPGEVTHVGEGFNEQTRVSGIVDCSRSSEFCSFGTGVGLSKFERDGIETNASNAFLNEVVSVPQSKDKHLDSLVDIRQGVGYLTSVLFSTYADVRATAAYASVYMPIIVTKNRTWCSVEVQAVETVRDGNFPLIERYIVGAPYFTKSYSATMATDAFRDKDCYLEAFKVYNRAENWRNSVESWGVFRGLGPEDIEDPSYAFVPFIEGGDINQTDQELLGDNLRFRQIGNTSQVSSILDNGAIRSSVDDRLKLATDGNIRTQFADEIANLGTVNLVVAVAASWAAVLPVAGGILQMFDLFGPRQSLLADTIMCGVYVFEVGVANTPSIYIFAVNGVKGYERVSTLTTQSSLFTLGASEVEQGTQTTAMLTMSVGVGVLDVGLPRWYVGTALAALGVGLLSLVVYLSAWLAKWKKLRSERMQMEDSGTTR